MIRALTEGLTSLIFPPNCLVCRRRYPRKNHKDCLCAVCSNKILLSFAPFCLKCGRPTNQPVPRCRICLSHHQYFDFAWSACIYDDFLKNLLLEFKYHRKTAWRHIFSDLMIRFIKDNELDITQFECIVPVPLFPSRSRERGYNQSLLLAEIIGETHKIPVRKDILLRCRPTMSQTLLNEKDRWTNIRGAFRISPLYKKNYKKVLIVDDLLTTGATVSEAARALKLSRVKTIGVLTLATVK